MTSKNVNNWIVANIYGWRQTLCSCRRKQYLNGPTGKIGSARSIWMHIPPPLLECFEAKLLLNFNQMQRSEANTTSRTTGTETSKNVVRPWPDWLDRFLRPCLFHFNLLSLKCSRSQKLVIIQQLIQTGCSMPRLPVPLAAVATSCPIWTDWS